MSRIKNTFDKLDRPALITFITAGDPDAKTSLETLKSLPESGADIIELGMPFTDPVADGPVIQEANNRALAAGANMKATLAMVRSFREDNDTTPIVLMGYANPLYAYGLEAFTKDAAAAGIDGLIIVDLPPEESAELQTLANKQGIDFIRLLTPTSDKKRLPLLLEGASGFLYYVSITGVTGAAKADLSEVAEHVRTIKTHTDLPVAVGFGIKTPEDVKAFAGFADAVVVGSAIIQSIVNDGSKGVKTLVSNLSGALKAE